MLPPHIQKGLDQYMESKYGPPSKLPRRKVSEEEFVRLLIESGVSEEEAKSQAFFAKGIGGDLQIGQEWVGIDATN